MYFLLKSIIPGGGGTSHNLSEINFMFFGICRAYVQNGNFYKPIGDWYCWYFCSPLFEWDQSIKSGYFFLSLGYVFPIWKLEIKKPVA